MLFATHNQSSLLFISLFQSNYITGVLGFAWYKLKSSNSHIRSHYARTFMDKKMKLDHLFGPKDSSSSSSTVFGSIFPPSSTVEGRDWRMQDVGCKNKGTQGNQSKQGGERRRNDEKETAEGSYYSSSIYYGGQENYCQRGLTTNTESHSVFKKDGEEDDGHGGNTSNGASRGNWWQGSLYY